MLQTFLGQMNWAAFAVAVIVYYVLGAFWYSPALFGKPWLRLIGKTKEELTGGSKMIFLYTFLLTVIIVFATSFFAWVTATHEIVGAIKVGALLAFGFSFTTFAINSMFAQRPFGLILIDAMYHVVGIIMTTIIIGLWR